MLASIAVALITVLVPPSRRLSCHDKTITLPKGYRIDTGLANASNISAL